MMVATGILQVERRNTAKQSHVQQAIGKHFQAISMDKTETYVLDMGVELVMTNQPDAYQAASSAICSGSLLSLALSAF